MSTKRSSKVERVLMKYDLEGLGDDLVSYWTADGDERKSLRELADYLNVRLLEAEMKKAGISIINDDPISIYEILTDEERSSGQHIEVRNRLQRDGVDIDELETDFVTYQAIRSYVKDVRDAEYEPTSDEDRISNDRDTIQRLLNRTTSVIEEKLTNLSNTDRITLGDFQLIFDVQVYCETCNTQRNVVELLEAGGCNCEE